MRIFSPTFHLNASHVPFNTSLSAEGSVFSPGSIHLLSDQNTTVWSLVLILHLKLLYNSSTGSDMMRVQGFIPYKGWNLTCHSNFIHFSHLKLLKSSIGINWSSSSYGADDQIHSSTCERFYKSRHFDIHVCEHNATTFPVVDIPAGTRNKYGLF